MERTTRKDDWCRQHGFPAPCYKCGYGGLTYEDGYNDGYKQALKDMRAKASFTVRIDGDSVTIDRVDWVRLVDFMFKE